MGKKNKVSKLTSWDIKDYLNAIHRTHILFNDASEVGLNLTAGNSLGDIAGKNDFMKKAVLDRLSMLAKEFVCNENFDLKEFLLDYKKAHDFRKDHFSNGVYFSIPIKTPEKDKKIKQFEIAQKLLDYLILKRPTNLKRTEIRILERLSEIDEGNGQVVTILILTILEILPLFSGGKSRNDFKFLHDFCETKLKNETLLVPEMLLFKEIVNNLTKKNSCKIVVFDFAYKLFRSISSHLDSERLYRMNKNRKQNCYNRYDIDGFWETEDKTELWEIERIKNSPEYIIRKWFVKPNYDRKYMYSSFLLLFTDKSHVYVRGPQYVHHFIKSEKIFKTDIGYYEVEYKVELGQTKLEFETEASSSSLLPKCLTKTEMSSHLEQLSKPLMEKEANRIESLPYYNEISNILPKIRVTPYNIIEDYYFTPALCAVTHNAVYIEADKGSNFHYYRIPVNVEKYKSLSHIDLSDTAGIVEIKDKKYLAFFDQDIFIDSEEEGIEKVSDCADWTL